jgi:hypothetical protein
MEGMLTGVDHMWLHTKGTLAAAKGGKTEGEDADHFKFVTLLVKTGGQILMLRDPTKDGACKLETDDITVIEGGGRVDGNYVIFISKDLRVDDGGVMTADGLGYTHRHGKGSTGANGLVNGGIGFDDANGASGGGHGGSGGRGYTAIKAGLAQGHVYEPVIFGSAGGSDSPSLGGINDRSGNGGGVLWMNVTNMLEIDGRVSANGAPAPADRPHAGGGAGGSVWLHCNEFDGYGMISADGGDGGANVYKPGGGGAGGRVSMNYWTNNTAPGFRFTAIGGGGFEAGGAGTSFIYNHGEEHRSLYVGNGGQMPINRKNHLHRYVAAITHKDASGNSLDYSAKWLAHHSGRTWILPEAADHKHAGKKGEFHFEELQIYGGANLAVINAANKKSSFHFQAMIGDRTGVVHVDKDQTMDLERHFIDLPFSTWTYDGGVLGLAPVTVVHGVYIQMAGTLHHVDDMTLHNNGQLFCNYGGKTEDEDANTFRFNLLDVQDLGIVHMETHTVDEEGIMLFTDTTRVDGGGLVRGTKVDFESREVHVADGGRIVADELGHHIRDGTNKEGKHGDVNVGIGSNSNKGASGGGHGGSGGQGAGQPTVGPAYGDLYQPYLLGSSGGTGITEDVAHGGRGGGIFWLNVTEHIHIDGTISANGGEGLVPHAGGGSGGSVWIHCELVTGYGKVTAYGGAGHTHSRTPGGGGAGGRVSMYFGKNETKDGFKFFGCGWLFCYRTWRSRYSIYLVGKRRAPYSDC